ncbi:S9 family peptidase [Luteipulveratus mongoliensis]|uniref:Peptidase S9 prolyl oligopeptidase catalytic domain-containing protein n=1 Tax=Luteipulveratus mongoliensis TaxID=571913 RepID=A0A0K1JPD7_9MICO|nr:prolyl oligopeptidase family serine peptidase [Luteipulveratus mongoliensis]AKU18453.1 hypothetical protein VV02_25680 [Luteipulveratus mongoliensis]
MTTPAPYGSWTSLLTTELITAGWTGLFEPRVDGDDIWWLETRPDEGGRLTLMRRRGDTADEITPGAWNVRTMVHEYGGGAYDVRGGVVAFSHMVDGRVYVIEGGREPRPITPATEGMALRYADLQIDLRRRRILCVREDHRADGEAVNEIVTLDLDGESEGRVLVSGHDFVAAPRMSPDGQRLAWVTWEHPSMPWDATQVWVGDADGAHARVIDGGEGVSICEIGWLRDGRLAYASDRSGFWNLTVDGEPLHQVDRDCADPAYMLGGRGWVELPDGRIAIREWRDAAAHLVVIGEQGSAQDVPVDVVSLGRFEGLANDVVTVIEYRDRPPEVARIDIATGATTAIKKAAEPIDPAYLPEPEAVTWQNADGQDVHGFLYLPRNPEFVGPVGDRPPLVVRSHGGPTSHAVGGYRPGYAYWTSRGFVILDVNYGGSTSYGRAYRERLHLKWGIVDVEDCCSGAEVLAARGIVDPKRLAIEGGSAGGYTTLAALAFRDTFAVGVSHFGIGDLETLARDTHKFESRYPDGLVGPYPEARDVYLERSPVNHVDQLDCAMLLLQGADDKVVPPNQATAMADAVRAKGKPVALKIFEGEGHGFRRSETLKATLDAELSFYAQVFGFTPAGDVPKLDIDNL